LLLLALTVAAANYARFAVGPFQETLRVALRLSDNQIALLQGPALAIPTVSAAIPLGFLIDRMSRVKLLSVLTLLSLVGSFLTAIATNFSALFAARCLVGLAASSTMTAAFSMLADSYAPSERGRANMFVVIGQVSGASVTYALGGELLAATQSNGWHYTMLIVMSPLLVLLGVPLGLSEPDRMASKFRKPSARQSLLEIWSYRRVLMPLLGGVVMVSIAECAALIWAVPTLTRNYGLSVDRIGTIMATALLVSGLVGAVAGGWLADLCQRSGGPARTLAALSWLLLLSIPASCFASLPNATTASAGLVLFMTVGTVIALAATTIATVVTPSELHGLFLSVLFATGTVFGIGVAPVLVSVVSGLMGGPDMIGRALTLICVTGSLLGTATFSLGRRDIKV